MNRKWKIALVVGGVVVALLAGSVAVTGYALAQGRTPPGAWGEGDSGPPMGQMERQGPGRGRMGRGPEDLRLPEYRDLMEATLAGELGISVEELQAARAEGKTLHDLAQELGIEPAELQAAQEAAHQAVLEQAVADGVITEELAEQIKERAQERMEQMPPPGWMDAYRDLMDATLAGELGVSVEELEAARAEAQTPSELPELLGVEPAEFRQALEVAQQAVLEQAVEDGVLTPEQAEHMAQRPGRPGGPGRGRPHGGMGQGFGPGEGEGQGAGERSGQPPAPPAPPSGE